MRKMTFKTELEQRCYQFSIRVIRYVDTLPSKRIFWIITDQVLRSATSVGANLIEGRSASSSLEFKRYYEIALKSANETEYWLYLLSEIVSETKDLTYLIDEINQICRMLAKGVVRLKVTQK